MRVTKALLSKLSQHPVDTLKALTPDEVAQIIKKANEAYHDKGAPVLTDEVYDLVVDYLKHTEPSHTMLKEVGSTPALSHTTKVKLPYYMGSMDKNKGDERTLTAFTQQFKGEYVISDKLDGISALLYFTSDGVKLYTRGDGSTGQDITHILKHINGIPDISKIMSANKTAKLSVRGELIMSKSDFHKVKDQGANARNMVAGVVNAKKPNMNILKLVKFVPYQLIEPASINVTEQMKFLANNGFTPVFNTQLNQSALTLQRLSDILVERRSQSPFEIDGIIVAHNQYYEVAKGKNPDHAFAFKSIITQETAEVTVTHIEWNVSKDGYLVPVVMFNPVRLSGVSIQRASGFNGEYIYSNKIGPGSRLIITRSGDVIPYIVSVLSSASSGEAQMPDVPFTWTETKKDIIASGENKEQQLRIIENFFTKADIAGIRAGTVAKLYAAGFHTVGSILRASVEEFIKVDGIQKKSAEKMVEAIKERMAKLKCVNLMDASNAFGRGFGERRLQAIINAFPKIEHDPAYAPSHNELLTVEGVSDKTAVAFLEGLAKYNEFKKTENLDCKQHILSPKAKKTKLNHDNEELDHKNNQQFGVARLSNKLENEVIVFTGFRDAALKNQVEDAGGVISDNISKKTTILVVKDMSSMSTKVQKAKVSGVKIMGLEEFKTIVSA